MENKINKLISLLCSRENEAYIHRVNWISFEKRIENYFRKINHHHDFSALGGLYLSNMIKSEPLCSSSHVYKSNFLNHIQIHTGSRSLNVYDFRYDGENRKLVPVYESKSALVFSQSVNGKVMVFLYPYKSSVIETNEENIILRLNIAPIDLTDREISKIFNVFIKYSISTSAISYDSRSLSFWRLWLVFRDFRNRELRKRKTLYFAEKIILLLLPALGICATLITSSKWPLW